MSERLDGAPLAACVMSTGDYRSFFLFFCSRCASCFCSIVVVVMPYQSAVYAYKKESETFFSISVAAAGKRSHANTTLPIICIIWPWIRYGFGCDDTGGCVVIVRFCRRRVIAVDCWFMGHKRTSQWPLQNKNRKEWTELCNLFVYIRLGRA